MPKVPGFHRRFRFPWRSAAEIRDEIDTELELQAAASIFTFFGVIALFLAIVGLYGVRAFSISRRTREFGVQMAMGATGRDVLRLVMREAMSLAAARLVLGLVLSIGLGVLPRGLLVRVRAARHAYPPSQRTALRVATNGDPAGSSRIGS